jgi:hypothetical protein
VCHAYTEGGGAGGSAYNYINPDYYKYVPWVGPGLQPVGYGHDSVAGHLEAIRSIETAVQGLDEDASLAGRRTQIEEIDEQGLLATPANSYINELVCEAARISILNEGKNVKIQYGKDSRVVG